MTPLPLPPPPPELQRQGIRRGETNLPEGRTIAINPRMVVTLFGEELLARLRQARRPTTE